MIQKLPRPGFKTCTGQPVHRKSVPPHSYKCPKKRCILLSKAPKIKRIKKIIHNSILCAVDEKGNELIVTGTGIGFQRHRGATIDPAQIERTYHMEEQKNLTGNPWTSAVLWSLLETTLKKRIKKSFPKRNWFIEPST